ncbi:hypothetical protein BDB00DRAFT_784919 [Zychaea mexicana]|uniref:uncharacterized protein n=1 Tax=Zychaea mexicana TaxID=64656 RepID=UPI0022FDF001|nr:uncharacterized protein BDB00DRAFT_784919 [Zychaea mexicana]KAI9497180.1 hypothetical protein BDB00DRAFT_784919 [Zychaea mexicana]
MYTLFQKAADLATLRSVHRSRLETRIHTSRNVREAQTLADDLIRQTPTSAKGYLLSGQLYQQQSKWRAASAVYSAGLRLVYPKTHHGYDSLKREKQRVMAIIAEKHNRQTPPLLPYDILGIIFDTLSLSDLLQCANVCESWFYAIVDWPDFWKRTMVIEDHHSSELRIVRKQARDIQGLLTVLLHSECQIVNSLHFESVTLQNTTTIVPLLARVIQSISPPLMQLSFLDVDFSKEVLGLVLDACVNITYFSYVSTKLTSHIIADDDDIENEDDDDQPPLKKLVRTSLPTMMRRREIRTFHPTTTFRMMTSLKFCGMNDTALLAELLQKCPNLGSLYLDSRDKINHGQLLHVTSHVCHHLRICCISKGAQFTSIRASRSSTGLVIQDGHVLAQLNDVCQFLKKLVHHHHQPVELLSVDYDLRIFTPRLFLNRHICHLRQLELCCKSLFRNTMMPTKNEPAFESSFCALLMRCPALQVLIIHDPFEVTAAYNYKLLAPYSANVTDTVLTTLASSCTQLEHLTVGGPCHEYTAQGFDRYASSDGSNRLKYLEVSLDPDIHNVPQLIVKLPLLTTLHCNLGLTRFVVEPLLQQRGGSLIEDRFFPW